MAQYACTVLYCTSCDRRRMDFPTIIMLIPRSSTWNVVPLNYYLRIEEAGRAEEREKKRGGESLLFLHTIAGWICIDKILPPFPRLAIKLHNNCIIERLCLEKSYVKGSGW